MNSSFFLNNNDLRLWSVEILAWGFIGISKHLHRSPLGENVCTSHMFHWSWHGGQKSTPCILFPVVNSEGYMKSGLVLVLCESLGRGEASYLKWDVESLVKSKQGSPRLLLSGGKFWLLPGHALQTLIFPSGGGGHCHLSEWIQLLFQ